MRAGRPRRTTVQPCPGCLHVVAAQCAAGWSRMSYVTFGSDSPWRDGVGGGFGGRARPGRRRWRRTWRRPAVIGSPSAGARAERCAQALSVTGPPALVHAMVGPAFSGRFTRGRVIPHRRLTRESARRSPPGGRDNLKPRSRSREKLPATITLPDLASGSDGTPGAQFATDWAQTNSTPGRAARLATELLKSARFAGFSAPIESPRSVNLTG
jgi:hypothetical protein